jgi:hypothetical protein
MARHVLSRAEQLRGIRAAIASPRTPAHLRKFLEKRRRELVAQREREAKRRARPKRKPGLLDFLGL